MFLALLLPQEQRTIALYPAIAFIIVGTLLTLRRGPDRHENFR